MRYLTEVVRKGSIRFRNHSEPLRIVQVFGSLARFYNSYLRTCLLSLNLPMNKEGRKRKVAIVTPPDVRSMTNPRTPSPKRCREENGENYDSEIGK